MQRLRSEIVKSDAVSSLNVGRDCKEILQLECALILRKVEGAAARWSRSGCGGMAWDEGGDVGAAESEGRSAPRLKANFFFGKDAVRVSSKLCSNESICCVK